MNRPNLLVAVSMTCLITIAMIAGVALAQTHTTITYTYIKVNSTFSHAPTYTSIYKSHTAKPVITVFLYSDGWVKLNATGRENAMNTLGSSIFSQTIIEFHKDKTAIRSHQKITWPNEMPTPLPGQANTSMGPIINAKIDAVKENGILKGEFHVKATDSPYSLEASGVFTVSKENNETVIDSNATIKGSSNTLDEVTSLIAQFNATQSSMIKVEKLKLSRSGDTLNISVRIRVSSLDALNSINLVTGQAYMPLASSLFFSPSTSVDIVEELHYTINVKPGLYESDSTILLSAGFKELAKKYAEYTLRVERAINTEGGGNISKILLALARDYEVEEGGILKLEFTSNGGTLITPKIRKTGAVNPLDTLKSLANLIASNLPSYEREDFLNTTIHLKPGDNGVKKIQPDTVKIRDLDKVKVEVSSGSEKTLTLAAAAALTAIIAVAALAFARKF